MIYVYVGVSPSFLIFLEVTTVIVVYLLFTYFPLLSFHGYAFQSWSSFHSLALNALALGYFLGSRLEMGRNHRFLYPPFLYLFAVSLRHLVNLPRN